MGGENTKHHFSDLNIDIVDELNELLENIDDTFSEQLLVLIDSNQKNDVEVYKKANIDRKLFSKIKSNKNYQPSKNTVITLAIALELDLHNTDRLLRSAGYVLSSSQKRDVIIQYFVANQVYDVDIINSVLFRNELKLLSNS